MGTLPQSSITLAVISCSSYYKDRLQDKDSKNLFTVVVTFHKFEISYGWEETKMLAKARSKTNKQKTKHKQTEFTGKKKIQFFKENERYHLIWRVWKKPRIWMAWVN